MAGSNRSELTQAELKRLLDYDPETGVFTWKARGVQTRTGRTWDSRFAGKVAGSPLRGAKSRTAYVKVGVRGRRYTAHRLAFLWVTGSFPEHEIDHADGNGQNNAWANIRPAIRAENARNVPMRRSNSTGRKGVKAKRNSVRVWYEAYITADGKRHYLGSSADPEEAAALYREASRRFHGRFARAA